MTQYENGPYFNFETYISNILNHRNASGPSSTNISAANFGIFNTSTWDARRIVFRLRLGF